MLSSLAPKIPWLKVILGALCILVAIVIGSQTEHPLLAIVIVLLFVAQALAWRASKNMRTAWLPVAIATGFLAALAMFLRLILGGARGGERLFILLIIFSCVFAIIAIEEGFRGLYLRWLAGGPVAQVSGKQSERPQK
jgi:hypothetical protein